MDRKLVGGIVNRQRDSSSFLSIFFPGTKGFWEEERPLIERLFFLLQTVDIHQSKFQSFKQQKQYLKRKGVCWPSVQKNRDHTNGGYGDLMLAKAWLSFQIFLSPPSMTEWISHYRSLSRLSLSATYVSLNSILGFYVFSSSPLFSISLSVPGFFVSLGFFFFFLCFMFLCFFFYYYFNCFFFNIHTQWLSNSVTLAKQYNVSLF